MMKKMKQSSLVILFLAVLLLQVGCLRTRGDLKEQDQRQIMQEQVTTLQAKNADSSARVNDMQEAIRDLSGRLLNAENRVEQLMRNDQSQTNVAVEQNQALKRQVDLLQQEISQLQGTIQGMQQEMAALKTAPAGPVKSSGGKSSKTAIYDEAEEHFKNKDWKRAIVTYQKYREESPKSSRVPEAIYKIGVSFQELGLKDEARAFYDEAVAKFPQSEGARKSKLRLRSLK